MNQGKPPTSCFMTLDEAGVTPYPHLMKRVPPSPIWWNMVPLSHWIEQGCPNPTIGWIVGIKLHVVVCSDARPLETAPQGLPFFHEASKVLATCLSNDTPLILTKTPYTEMCLQAVLLSSLSLYILLNNLCLLTVDWIYIMAMCFLTFNVPWVAPQC